MKTQIPPLFTCVGEWNQVTDYLSIVQVKVDMDSIKIKLKNTRYPTVAALFTDIFMVYTNATTYYERGGKLGDVIVYKAAKVGREEEARDCVSCTSVSAR